MSKLELLQVEHDKIEFETENVEAANSNLKRELEEKNRESVRMKTENVRLMQSISDYRFKGDLAKKLLIISHSTLASNHQALKRTELIKNLK